MEYNVTVNKVDDENMQFDSSVECLNIALEEYRHVMIVLINTTIKFIS